MVVLGDSGSHWLKRARVCLPLCRAQEEVLCAGAFREFPPLDRFPQPARPCLVGAVKDRDGHVTCVGTETITVPGNVWIVRVMGTSRHHSIGEKGRKGRGIIRLIKERGIIPLKEAGSNNQRSPQHRGRNSAS